MTHVFIVNEQTFKVHLEYMFAGTGANFDAPFLLDASYQNPRRKDDGVTSASERNLVGMIADVSRIKDGDNIIFYVQASNGPGTFYGMFKAVGTPFYEKNKDNYLYNLLGKNLNFRIKIQAGEVYSNGISEYEALDSLSGINHPSDMCWSLIYRKLKGNRGCTMITDAETARLYNLIKCKNNNTALTGKAFTYDANSKNIMVSKSKNDYDREGLSLDIKDRLLIKAHRNVAFEPHLQAYVIQNATKPPLSNILGIPEQNVWIGNEVSCGVGMQRIDVMTAYIEDKTALINVIELKCCEPYDDIINYQLPRYINWLKDYIVPTFKDINVVISPIVLAKKFKRKDMLDNFKACSNKFKTSTTGNLCMNPIKYIAFDIEDKDISFEKIF